MKFTHILFLMFVSFLLFAFLPFGVKAENEELHNLETDLYNDNTSNVEDKNDSAIIELEESQYINEKKEVLKEVEDETTPSGAINLEKDELKPNVEEATYINEQENDEVNVEEASNNNLEEIKSLESDINTEEDPDIPIEDIEIILNEIENTAQEQEEAIDKDELEEPKKQVLSFNAAQRDEVVLRNGDQNDAVIELKKNLKALGFGKFPENPSDKYGNVTESVVKQFQKSFGLQASGVTNQETLHKIHELLTSDYRKGQEGEHVKELKKKLSILGFGNFPENPSLVYGDVTERVVRQFQAYFDLPTTGVVDEQTKTKIHEALNPPYQDGDQGKHIALLKKKLRSIGFGNFPKDPSITYGKVTTGVVKDFQQFFDLPVNGIIDISTFNKIHEVSNHPFANGTVGDHVIQLKKHLTTLGFGKFPKYPSDIYGNVTTRVVANFQQYYKLKNTSGKAVAETIKEINKNLTTPFRNGNKNSKVVSLKNDLKRLGFGNFPKNPSNVYGNVTERVVKQFQKANGLVVNGIMDSVSMNVLESSIKKLNQSIKIFIDAGHGGRDPGALGNGLQEKNLNITIAKEIERRLKQYGGVSIKMARTNDKTLSLDERTTMANEWKADYYFSVHINAGGGTGIESFIHRNATKDEINKQNIIHEHILSNLSVNDRGKKRANFHVLKESNMSAILFEYLFIDNKEDSKKLKDTSYLKKLGRLTADALAKAFNLKKI